MIGGDKVQPRSPFDMAATSSGQFSLSNAARAWTKLWLVLAVVGWTPAMNYPCSPPVRVSFRFGRGSFIDGLISNPRFFELTMGWPIDWTAPEASVTGFAHWLQRSRTALSALPFEPLRGFSEADEAPPGELTC